MADASIYSDSNESVPTTDIDMQKELGGDESVPVQYQDANPDIYGSQKYPIAPEKPGDIFTDETGKANPNWKK